MAENPLKPKSKAPSIWMPDEQGNWIEVIPFAGFPGGKTKTIAVDLSNRFLCDDRRIRLVSNMELCWDEIFYSDDSKTASSELLDGRPTDVACRVTVQPLKHADLHFRGFSRLVTQPYYAPKKYDYQQVTIESIWPPMTGRFTKLGEVTDLLVDADDLQAVMGAGDEMTLRFQSTDPALPEGWVRDFVLFNVGWDKDADLNTVHGQSVEPLPFRSMKQYPYQPHQFFPDSPRHREFVETRQTRIQSSIHFWNQIRDFESTRTTTD